MKKNLLWAVYASVVLWLLLLLTRDSSYEPESSHGTESSILASFEPDSRIMNPESTPTPTLYLITAYCPCVRCCGRWSRYGLTATGTLASSAGCAADRALLGRRVTIPGYNNGLVLNIDDTGRLIKPGRLDIRMKNHADARAWGRRYLKVTFD